MKWKVKGDCYLYKNDCLSYLYRDYRVDNITESFGIIKFTFYGTNEEMRKFVASLSDMFWFTPTKTRKVWF